MLLEAEDPHLYQTRQQVIEKLLQETSSGSSSSGSSQDRSLARQKQWIDAEKFVEDNLIEVYQKLPSLEKQIWGKLVVMEGNLRTAKAYLRHPVITVDGSDAEFDGMRIGISRFENTRRSGRTYKIFNEILQGIKLRIDPDGNIWAKRMCYSPVFLKPLYRNRQDDLFVIDERPVKVFDIRRFREILIYELRSDKVDKRKLEKCCLICLKFSVDHYDLLKTPCYIILIHLVAMELLSLVIPKDNEMSSPSSSFAMAGPSYGAAGGSYTGNRATQGFNQPLHRTSARKGGGVFKRIIRKEEEQSRAWPTQQTRLPIRHQYDSEFDNSGVFQNELRAAKDGFGEKHYASMVDLRSGSSPSSGLSGHGYFSRMEPTSMTTGGGFRSMGNRVFSMEHLAAPPGPRFPTQQASKHLVHPSTTGVAYNSNVALQMDGMRVGKRWRSQDSGIGSGSGSYNSK